jgi:LysM repeat protein
MKNSIPRIALPMITLALASCASQKADEYDTPNPYGQADAAQPDPYGAPPPNPVYDTPAAYEEGSAVPASPPYPNIPGGPTSPAIPSVPSSATAAVPNNGSAIIHTVVKGDTLSGLSTKYNVPIPSIRQANQMTNDIVVLGRKMVIPPR